MSTPQKENGYTPIANEILEALARINIGGEARRIIDVVMRKTYGFNKKEDRIALSQFVEFTGMDRKSVCRAINKLISMELLIKIDDKNGSVFIFQKNNKKWVSITQKNKSRKSPNGHVAILRPASGNMVNQVVAILPHTKDNTTKDKTKDKEWREQSSLVAEFIKHFEVINPACKNYYKNTVQRKASEDIINTYGFDKAVKMISFLPKNNSTPFLPKATTPVQLWEKWSAIESGWMQEMSKIKITKDKNKVAF